MAVAGDFAFLGSVILENVIRDLIYSYGLADASKMFLAGSRYTYIRGLGIRTASLKHNNKRINTSSMLT